MKLRPPSLSLRCGDDYEKFLAAVYYKTLPDLAPPPRAARGEDLAATMEASWPAAERVAAESVASAALEEGAGHQIYGNWQVCQFNDKDAPFPRACVDENARADPGFFGFWPEVNRARAYWFQIVTGATAAAPLGNLPVTDLLRFVLKPQLDRAVAATRGERAAPPPRAAGDAIADARRAIAAGAPRRATAHRLSREDALATLDAVAAFLAAPDGQAYVE